MKLKRSSALLIHITSLPSPYGIGDLGETAYKFVDYLHQSGHHYWQLLPLNPTDSAFGHSPYSSFSAFGGNPLLISPDLLVEDGFLSKQDLLSSPKDFNEESVDFKRVSTFKKQLIDIAFHNFLKKEYQYEELFYSFCEKSKTWLDDYALYLTLKDKYQKVWTEWPKEVRDRDFEVMANLNAVLADNVKKEKFIQYLFFSQWEKLVKYSHAKEVSFIGDIPYYINHDSVDCWAHSAYFKLDINKLPTQISGVPPDYFSESGQLWGTPVFDWQALKKNEYDWWLERLGQNLLLYDMVRLDHFRAFSAYWEVPAKETTAINGTWETGPGHHFFKKVREKFPEMPFIAEDLGSLDQPVYELLENFNFPGMKVLQFAFGEEKFWENPYIPHHHTKNSIVYTGTHDNNTSSGWFDALNQEEKDRFSRYAGMKATQKNIHQLIHRLALMSVSDLAIIPLQDILGLDEKAIMNRPGTNKGNWTWRLKPNQLHLEEAGELKKMNECYGRWKEKEAEENVSSK